jgi:hypothetical protein
MSCSNSLQNTSIDLTNGNNPKTPPRSPDSVDGPWIPQLSDSSYEKDLNWKHFYEGTLTSMPSDYEKTDDDNEEEDEEDEKEDEGDISSPKPKKRAQEKDGGRQKRKKK